MNKKAKVLFIYPNERHMSTIPPSIALFSQLLKNEGHTVGLFDTTFYELDDEIKLKGSDESKVDRLTIRPDERHYNKDTKVEDDNGKKTLSVRLTPVLEKDDDIYITTQEGDRLDNLALTFYGSPTHWWFIAHTNNITTMNLEAGLTLRIPASLSDAQGK